MDADVIVIGAGAAGLAAARSLARASLRTIVLEARDRVGGRVLSEPTARAVLPAELGAEFIHGPAPETMAILREIGSAAIATGGESWVANSAGLLEHDDRDFGSSAGIFGGARELAEDETVERYLRRFANDPVQRQAASEALVFAEGFDAVDPTIASVRGIADEWGSGVDATSARPIGGYPPIFEHLLEACVDAGVDIRLECIVERVSWRRGAVTVEARDASGEGVTLQARAVIVTLPAGVLNDPARRCHSSPLFRLPSATRWRSCRWARS